MTTHFDPDYLTDAAERPQIKSIKNRSYELLNLQSGMKILDIGCGPAVDTIKMAEIIGKEGMIYGIDADPSMINIANQKARQNGLSDFVFHKHSVSDNLDFENDFFDGSRCERLTQHVSTMQAKNTLLESIRVTKTNKPIVFIDSDWTSLSIHSINPRFERTIANLMTYVVKNGFAARGLPELFKICGLINIKYEVNSLCITFTEFETLIKPAIDMYVLYGYVDSFSWNQELEYYEELSKHNVFYCSLNIVTVYGETNKK